MNLYHYYDKKTGPFRNITDLDREDAIIFPRRNV